MYRFDSRVRYSETDEQGRLSLTGILNYLQDCSTFQSEDLGIGIEYLNAHNRAWWVTSWQIVIDRAPVLGERIVISTWPYDFKGIYGYRNFAIQDLEGRYLVKANSIWFFYDTKNQRPVRAAREDVEGYGKPEERLDMKYAPRRISLPEEYEEQKAIVVARHHLDTNHHVNNARYVEIARELLPEDTAVREIRVEYKKAAVLGDCIVPRVTKTEDKYLIALCDRLGSAFAVIMLQE
ncbi:MAG: acyl-[acyl-carrier-protein] thioesterase [Hungatella sp.]|nr:acyl-[acyl-carrier-protein] thioesterase [Hungatella sp.]